MEEQFHPAVDDLVFDPSLNDSLEARKVVEEGLTGKHTDMEDKRHPAFNPQNGCREDALLVFQARVPFSQGEIKTSSLK